MSTALMACMTSPRVPRLRHGAVHRRPAAGDVEGVAAAHDAGQLVVRSTAAAAGLL